MAEQEFWKGKFVDREWLKSLLRDGFRRCAKQDIEAVIGSITNDIEEYVAGEVLLNTIEAMKSIATDFQKAIDFQKQVAEGISDHQVKRRASQIDRGTSEP